MLSKRSGTPLDWTSSTPTLQWLDQKRLVKKRHVEDFIVIRATQRGLDVSVGRSRQSGVRFPYLDAEQWPEQWSEQGEEDNS